MNGKRLWMAIGLAIACVLQAGLSLAQCKIDGFNSARSGIWAFIDGGEYTNLRANLNNPAFFSSASGAVPFGITILAGQTTVTGASLTFPNSTVFVSGWTTTSSYTAAERTAIWNYVLSGGNFLGQFDDTGHSIADLFGITQPSVQADANSSIINSSHVIMNGPFGTVSSLIAAGNIGQFSVTPGVGQVLATNTVGGSSPGASVIVFERGALGPTSGRVVIDNDANYGSLDQGGGDDTVFMLNTLAYLCGVPNVPGGNTFYFPMEAYQGNFSTLTEASNSLSSFALNPGWTWQYFDSTGASIGTCGGSLAANGSDGCVVTGSNNLGVKTGWTRARSSNAFTFFPQEIFKFQNGGSLFAVGVPPATPGRNFTLVGPFSANEQVGISILSLPTNPATANVTVKAFNGLGTQIGNTASLSVCVGCQTSAFVGQMVGVASSGTVDNSITISSDQQIAVLGLVLENGGASGFASIPIFSGRTTLIF